jgi:hypothetical protein
MTINSLTALPTASISINDDGVQISDLFVADPVLAEFLASYPADRRADQLASVIAVGVRGLTTMGVGATVQKVGEEMDRLLASATERHASAVGDIIESGSETLAGRLDPAVRSSLTAQALGEIEAAHAAMLDRLDLDRTDSHSARLVGELSTLLGPEGPLRQRLAEVFDTASDGSAMGRLLSAVDARFTELRDLLVGSEAAAREADRGTAKGLDYEDAVIAQVRAAAAEIGGCVVEATGSLAGSLDAAAKVGDGVLTLADGTRVVVEAKNTSRISLTGKDGILAELDRAMINREAQWAVCVSAQDAYPQEVGAFGIYGNRLLIIDDGEGTLLRAGLRWVQGYAASNGGPVGKADLDAATRSVDRLRQLAQRFSTAKRALTGIRGSVDTVRGELEGLRTDLLDLVDDIAAALAPAGRSDPGDQ